MRRAHGRSSRPRSNASISTGGLEVDHCSFRSLQNEQQLLPQRAHAPVAEVQGSNVTADESGAA